MFRDDKVRVRHILDAAAEAVELARGKSRGDLDKDRMLNLSLVRLLEIIGEAAKGVSQDFQNTHPELPWRSMTGLRNRLIHGYFDVNFDIVWQTIQEDLPILIEKLRQSAGE